MKLIIVASLIGAVASQQLQSTPGQFTCAINSDFWGNDLSNAPATDSQACQQLCQRTHDCSAFTYVPGTCYMKFAANTFNFKQGATACAIVPSGVDCYGQNDWSSQYNANNGRSDFAGCQDICAGAYSFALNTCWCKNGGATSNNMIPQSGQVLACVPRGSHTPAPTAAPTHNTPAPTAAPTHNTPAPTAAPTAHHTPAPTSAGSTYVCATNTAFVGNVIDTTSANSLADCQNDCKHSAQCIALSYSGKVCQRQSAAGNMQNTQSTACAIAPAGMVCAGNTDWSSSSFNAGNHQGTFGQCKNLCGGSSFSYALGTCWCKNSQATSRTWTYNGGQVIACATA
jgi:hypothetical protein